MFGNAVPMSVVNDQRARLAVAVHFKISQE
jgi:hypothetical protein